MERPTKDHFSAVKQILRYIKGTMTQGCVYGRMSGEPQLLGYSDSDLAGDVDDRKSTTGVLYFFGNCHVSWASQKQRIVAQSSCEAEYVAAAAATCQGIWLSRLIGELLGQKPDKIKLKIDNQSAIALCKNPVFHERSKHIDIRYHLVRNCVEEGKLTVEYVGTEEQLADLLTKPLARFRFQALKEKIGIKTVDSDIKIKGVKC
jgi:hypothetical protein